MISKSRQLRRMLAILLALSLGTVVALSFGSAEADDLDPCGGLGSLKSVRDATVNRTTATGAAGTGSLVSAGGSFKEHGVGEPCDPAKTYGPFEVESGGRLNASIKGDPPVPNVWSLYNANTGMSIRYAPRYGKGYGPEDAILGVSANPDNVTSRGSAEWPGPGKITVVISPPSGAGPLSGSCFSQGYSANVDIVSLKPENPARAGDVLLPGDRIKTGASGGVAAVLNYNGGALWIGPNSDLILQEYNPGLSQDTLKLDNPSGRVSIALSKFMEEGLPMPMGYYEDPVGFLSHFEDGTITEASAILDSNSDPYEASIELMLFLNSRQGELTVKKAAETAWTLFGVDEWDLLEVAFEAIPVYGQVFAALAKYDDLNDYLDVMREELKNDVASKQSEFALNTFKKSKGWTESELDSNLTSLGSRIEDIRAKIGRLKGQFSNDLLRVEDEFRMGKMRAPEVQEYVLQRRLETYGEISRLESTMASLLLQKKALELYRAPIVRGTCEKDLKRPKVPTLSPCPNSASIRLYEGTLRYTGSHLSGRDGPEIDLGSYKVIPKGTELVCEKRGDGGRVAVIEGSALIANATGSDTLLKSGEQIDLSSGAVSSYNLSTDDRGLVGGIPLRDLPLSDAAGQPYGFYMPAINGSLPAGWIWQDPGSDATLNLSSPGTLSITVPDGNEFWDASTQAPRLLHKVTGDFELEGELMLRSNGTDHAITEFLMYSPGSYLGYLAKQMKPDGLGAHYRVIGGGWNHLQGMNYLPLLNEKARDCQSAPDMPVRFRMTRHGDIWKTYWSPDGERWNISTRQEIAAPDTVWVGWLFKRNAYDGLRSEPAVTTLRGFRLETAPRGSMDDSGWDLIQVAGSIRADNSTVRMELDGSHKGALSAFRGERLEGDFDAVVRFKAMNWSSKPGEYRSFGLEALNTEAKNLAYIGIREKDGEPRRYMTDLAIDERYGRYQWKDTSDIDGYMRILRQNGSISTYRWQDCQWVRLDKFEAGFDDPVYILIWISNKDETTANATLSLDFSIEQIATGDAAGGDWAPAQCSLIQPVPLPPGLRLPGGMDAVMYRTDFALGSLFFDRGGTAYAFSSQRDKQKLVAIYANGTAVTYAESEVLAGVNGKSGASYGEAVLMTVDYWPEGGNRLSGIFELHADGTYRQLNSTSGYGGLGCIIPAPDGGWYFSDFEKDNIFHLAEEGAEAATMISKGGIPPGLGTLAYDSNDEVLYALNRAGDPPFGGNYSLYRIESDGQAVLVAAINETSRLNGGMAISQKGPFGRAIYVSDIEGGEIFRVESDGALTPVITGLPRPGDMQFSPATGDLLVVCDEGKTLLWAGSGPREGAAGPSAEPSSRYTTSIEPVSIGPVSEKTSSNGATEGGAIRPVLPVAASAYDLTGDWVMRGEQDGVENSGWTATLTLRPDGMLSWVQTEGASVGATRSGSWEVNDGIFVMRWVAPKGGLINWTSGLKAGGDALEGRYTAENVPGGSWSAVKAGPGGSGTTGSASTSGSTSVSGVPESIQMADLQGEWIMEGAATGLQNSDWVATLMLNPDGTLIWRETEGATVGATRNGRWSYDGSTITLEWTAPKGGRTVWTSSSVSYQEMLRGTYSAERVQGGTWSARR